MYKSTTPATLRGMVVPVHAMKVAVQLHSFFNSVGLLEGGELSASCPGHFAPRGKKPLVPTAQMALWATELVWTLLKNTKLSGIQPRLLGRPDRCLVTVPNIILCKLRNTIECYPN
jgi:hypothetical protein